MRFPESIDIIDRNNRRSTASLAVSFVFLSTYPRFSKHKQRSGLTAEDYQCGGANRNGVIIMATPAPKVSYAFR